MNAAGAKINIISRYVPIAKRAGHFTYFLELLRFLHASGFQLELDVLDIWFVPENIPGELQQIADIVLMPASYVQRAQNPGVLPQAEPSVFRRLYRRLPAWLLAPLRQAWYGLQGKIVPGHHAAIDAIATEAEVQFVSDRLAERGPDVLIANETFLGNLLSAFRDNTELLKVSIAFDLHHQRHDTLQRSGARHSSWSREKEAGLLGAADVVVAIHEEDRRTLTGMLAQPDVLCVPMAVPYHAHAHDEQVPGRCIFVGSSIEPNVQGLTWFLREVWPQVLRGDPESTLHVCGTVCGAISETVPNIKLLGRVDELDNEYAAAEVCLIPLQAGSGLKIKLVEALSHGRACVATSVGIQGVRELMDKAVLLADTPEEFAEAVLKILQDSHLRKTMQEVARQYVTTRLAPENAYSSFVERICKHMYEIHGNHDDSQY